MAEAFVDRFFSALQKQHLKQRGYKKERRTFSRETPEYIERIQFQGSQWNSSGEPWRFYINVGIQFRDLPLRQPDRDFPNTHAHGRIETLVSTGGGFFELTEQNTEEMLKKISALATRASNALPKIALTAYQKCKEGQLVWFGVT